MAPNDLIELVVQLSKRIEEQEQRLEVQGQRLEVQAKEIKALEAENAKLKQLLASAAKKKGSSAPKFTEDYSVEKHTGKGKSKRSQDATGGRPQSAKLELVERTVDVYEAGVPPSACVARGSQCVWRIEDGRVQYICYRFLRILRQPPSRR
jgi:regulator of replication initiation timing